MAKQGFVLDGDKALAKALNELPNKLFKQTIKKANAEAMKPVSQAAKAAAKATAGSGGGKISPVVAKALSKSIGRVTKVYGRHGNVVTVVGPRAFSTYQTENGKSLNINYLEIEFGDPEDGLEPQAFMRKTWDSMVGKVERDYAQSVKIGLAKIVERAAKK